MNGFFLSHSINTGEFNMEYDKNLLEYSIQKDLKSPIFRLYGWSPACVSLGRNQSDEHINKTFCKENNIDIVRRLTGGRALLHDNELTYSFVCPIVFLKNGETVIQSYKEISGALALGLKKLGINAEFPIEKKAQTSFEYCMSLATGADLSINNKKIIGSAQFRKQGYILQHGSIMFDYDKIKLENIFGEKPQTEKITTIKELNEKIKLEDLCNALKVGVEEFFNIDFQTSSNIEFDLIKS